MSFTPRIDLASDTVTRPTAAMRAAMAAADVGDEQRGEDPSTNALCERVAGMLGKEAALFLPSGVMCNQIAILVHCRPGDEILADKSSHIIGSEGGGPAALAGAMVRALDGDQGVFTPEQLIEAIRPPKRNAPRTRLVALEQTVNQAGGCVWPEDRIRSIAGAAHERGLAVHMDGARILNAAVASGVAARCFAGPCDSAWLDLSKGLGCPVGGVLAGSREFIEEAWRWKHRLGGAMRQSGFLAAAGLYALDHHVERLAEDHAKALKFAEAIVRIPGIRLDQAAVQTNLVFFDVRGTGFNAKALADALLGSGIRIGALSDHRMRAVTHMDVSAGDVEEAAAVLASLAAQRR